MGMRKELEAIVNKATDLGARLPKWREPGCLVNLNGSNNWQWLQDANAGEYMLFAERPGGAQMSAHRAGMNVTVHKLSNGDYQVTKIA